MASIAICVSTASSSLRKSTRSALINRNTKSHTLASLGSLGSSKSSLIGKGFVVSQSAVKTKKFFHMGTSASAATFEGKTFYDFTVKGIDGNDVALSEYKGKVALVVNVASACGLTNSNYTELTAIYDKYKDKGFVILAFPSNQFGAQEPGSNEQIKEFACSRYKATFPLFSKIDVNGENADPVYKYLKSQKGAPGPLGAIKWNFSKFLVDKEGKVVERYAPTTSPSSIEADIVKIL